MGLLGVKAESSHNLQAACWITCLHQVANGISYFILKSQVLSGFWSNMWVCHLNRFIKSKIYFALNERILLCWVLNQKLSIIKMFLLLLTSLLAINGTIIFLRKIFNVGGDIYTWNSRYQCVQIISKHMLSMIHFSINFFEQVSFSKIKCLHSSRHFHGSYEMLVSSVLKKNYRNTCKIIHYAGQLCRLPKWHNCMQQFRAYILYNNS